MTAASIKQCLAKIQPDSKRLWGRLTAHEMICHISDPLRDFLKIRNVEPVMPTFLRPLLKFMMLGNLPFRKNALTVKPYLLAANGGATKPVEFEADMQTLIELLDRFTGMDDAFQLGPHAAVGLLTKAQAGRLMFKHLDHHLRQFGA